MQSKSLNNNKLKVREAIQPFAVYSSKDAANLLDLNINTVQKHIKAGNLRAKNIGGKKKIYRILGIDLLMFMGLFEGFSRKDISTSIVTNSPLPAVHTPDTKHGEE